MQTPNQEYHVVADSQDLASSNEAGVIRVLHVNDDPSHLEVARQILMSEGNFEVHCALSVDEALRRLESQSFDVIISDYEMPEKNGLELLRELRGRGDETPFILFTGKGREEVAIQALNLGANHYINRQGSPETVYGELSHYLRSLAEKSKAKLQNKNDAIALRNIQEAVVMSDADFTITAWNKAAEEMFGWQTQEAIGKKVNDLFGFIEVDPNFEEVIKTVKEKGQFKGEVIYRNKKGQRHDGLLNVASITVNGKFGGNVAICHDTTERKKAEEDLKKLKSFDERIIDSLVDSLLVIDPKDYRIMNVNNIALRQFMLKKEELIGKTCYEVEYHRLSPCQSPNITCPIREALKTGNPITVEHTILDENNNQRIVEVTARPLTDPEGKTVIIHVSREITERKQMEKKIQEAEKRYRSLFDWAPLGILLIDPQTGQLIEFNQVAHEQLGYFREEFEKIKIYDYKALETPIETKAIMEKILRQGKFEWESKHRTKSGEVRDVIIISQVIELFGKKLLQSIYRDVTEAKKIEVALMDSESKYRQLVELAQEGVWALNLDNCTVYVNPRMAEMLGYAESEIVGKNLSEFLVNLDEGLTKQKLEGYKTGHQDQCEFKFVRKDGGYFDASVSASSFVDDEGASIGTLVLVSDVTKRKRAEAELKRSRDKVEIMNEKLRVVGGLTRHDVRNKLCAITGNAYLLKKRHADQPDIVNCLGHMELAIKEVEKIFGFAKTYEQLGSEELSYVDVEAKLNEAAALFSGPLPKITNECHGLFALADSFLRQLFYNFIDNTRKYGKKAATIRLYYEETDQDTLRLVYEDDGVGIPTLNKEQLFREGFSTGGSTGFGLYLSKKMMDVYGWEIEETGEPGEGAKFVMTIPRASEAGLANYQIRLSE